ncbi:MAG: hypothetical protein LLG04_18830 [Parachlamydia sp.]|nr:hypothetical protein [Parachlamydia sp.]
MTPENIELAKILGMFASILLILRWFKTDTAEMIKIYSEATDTRVKAIEEKVGAIEGKVETMRTETNAVLTGIREDMKMFQNKMYELESKKKG